MQRQAVDQACMPLLLQENYFFDGPNRELNSRRVVLRLRFYDVDKKAYITVKVGCSGPGFAGLHAQKARQHVHVLGWLICRHALWQACAVLHAV